jgi:hypothetical protein
MIYSKLCVTKQRPAIATLHCSSSKYQHGTLPCCFLNNRMSVLLSSLSQFHGCVLQGGRNSNSGSKQCDPTHRQRLLTFPRHLN